MKLLRAMIRPERETEVVRLLEDGGFFAMSKTPILGRGIERGIQVGNVSYDEISKYFNVFASYFDGLADVLRGDYEDHESGVVRGRVSWQCQNFCRFLSVVFAAGHFAIY